jgi:hypothetical protein
LLSKLKGAMETGNIIQSLEETIMKIKNAEHEYLLKKEILEKELEDKKSDILSQLGFRIGDLVTLEIHEYRDDRISCFAIAQTAECFIHGVEMRTDEKGVNFFVPVLRKKDKKKNIFHNFYLSWDLKKDGKIVLSHRAEEHIIQDKYTPEKIEEIRKYLISAQKI